MFVSPDAFFFIASIMSRMSPFYSLHVETLVDTLLVEFLQLYLFFRLKCIYGESIFVSSTYNRDLLCNYFQLHSYYIP